MSKKDAAHKYDIKELEDKLHEAYIALKEVDDADTRTRRYFLQNFFIGFY